MDGSTFARFRLSIFSIVSYLAVADLLLAYYSWNVTSWAVGQAAAILTLITIPPMILLSILRKGAFPCMVIVEYLFTSFLWLFWLATGVVARFAFAQCHVETSTLCPPMAAMVAFNFVTWVLLFLYNNVLFVLAIRANQRAGGGVWMSYISEVDFSAANPLQQITLAQPTVVQTLNPLLVQNIQGYTIPQTYMIPPQVSPTYPEPTK